MTRICGHMILEESCNAIGGAHCEKRPPCMGAESSHVKDTFHPVVHTCGKWAAGSAGPARPGRQRAG